MYTQKEILRHERCRAYALYGTKTPNMIAAEKKKAAKKITAGTTGATMTTKKTAPIAVSTERMVAVKVEGQVDSTTMTNASSTSTTSTSDSISTTSTAIDAVVKKERENAKTRKEDDPGNNNDGSTDVSSLESRCNDDGCHPLLLNVDSVLPTLV